MGFCSEKAFNGLKKCVKACESNSTLCSADNKSDTTQTKGVYRLGELML
jgi:hypothetical protein